MVTILHGWSFIRKCGGVSGHSISCVPMLEIDSQLQQQAFLEREILFGQKFGICTYLNVTWRKTLHIACKWKGSKFLTGLCTWKKYWGENHEIKLRAADSLKNCPNWEWDCEAHLTVARTLKGLALNLLIPYYGVNLQCLWPCKISLRPADFKSFKSRSRQNEMILGRMITTDKAKWNLVGSWNDLDKLWQWKCQSHGLLPRLNLNFPMIQGSGHLGNCFQHKYDRKARHFC